MALENPHPDQNPAQPEGCPWDQKQTLKNFSKYLREELQEYQIELDQYFQTGQKSDELTKEFGDLLFNALFILKLSREEGLFPEQAPLKLLIQKMIRRHPHVFSNQNLEMNKSQWDQIKAKEQSDQKNKRTSVPRTQEQTTPLIEAMKISSEAAQLGFDWPDVHAVIEKLEEEISELKIEISNGKREKIKEELGDILFSLINIARHLNLDLQKALAKTNQKFEKRFSYVLTELQRQKKNPKDTPLEELESLWQAKIWCRCAEFQHCG